MRVWTKTGRVAPARVAWLALLVALSHATPLDAGPSHLALVQPGLSTAEPEVPATLTLAEGGRDLRLSGDLTEGVAARVDRMLAANPRVERLHLTSDGGLVEEAFKIGRLVKAHRLSTYVPDACASACTLIFVQGRKRYVGPLGRLGFHAPYEVDEAGNKLKVDPAPERAAYRSAGLPASFVTRVLTVAPADLWIPTTEELRKARIVTDVVREDHFPEGNSTQSSRSASRSGSLRHVAVAGTSMHSRR